MASSSKSTTGRTSDDDCQMVTQSSIEEEVIPTTATTNNSSGFTSSEQQRSHHDPLPTSEIHVPPPIDNDHQSCDDEASSVTTTHFRNADLFVPSMYPSIQEMIDASEQLVEEDDPPPPPPSGHDSAVADAGGAMVMNRRSPATTTAASAQGKEVVETLTSMEDKILHELVYNRECATPKASPDASSEAAEAKTATGGGSGSATAALMNQETRDDSTSTATEHDAEKKDDKPTTTIANTTKNRKNLVDSHVFKESALIVSNQTAAASDDVLLEIQPLPQPSNNGIDISLVPGAHAVGGPPRFPILEQQPPPRMVEGGNTADADVEVTTRADGYTDTSEAITVCSEVVEGQTVDLRTSQHPSQHVPTEISSTRRGWLLVIAATLLTAATVSTVLGIVLSTTNSSSDNNKNKGNKGSRADESAPYTNPPYSLELRPQTIEAIQSDPNPGKPFARANQWMLNDPYMSTYSPAQQNQRFVMAWFYYVTNGSNWTRSHHWLSYDVSECEWYNDRSSPWVDVDLPTCNAASNLQVLSLPNNNLEGAMPFIHETLPHLLVIDIGFNRVGGVVPAMRQIEVNVISHNRFSGRGVQISNEIAQDFKLNLRVNKYDGNLFRGSRTGLICPYAPGLQILNATDNNLRGVVSPVMKHCTNLTYFGIGRTQIGGTLPSQLGLLTNLQEIYLSGSRKLEGEIPSEFGNLQKLTRLDVTGTSLTGMIPDKLCDRIRNGKLTLFANCTVLECCGR